MPAVRVECSRGVWRAERCVARVLMKAEVVKARVEPIPGLEIP